MITMRNWPPPADANRVARDDQGRRQLAALKFIGWRLNAIQNIENHDWVIAGRDDLFGSSLLFKVQLQNRIEFVIWWQRLIVKLSRRQFRRRALLDNCTGNNFAAPIEQARQRVNFSF